jgi:hypothetical protein
MDNIKLSRNFWLGELTKSPTAERFGISNDPSSEHLVNLTVITHKILQPVREQFGVITVNSGYRSPALNTKVGGSKTSQHCNGEAVDFEQLGTSNPEVAKWITKNLDWDQIILEFYIKGQPNSGWIHCSYKKDGTNRRKITTALRTGGKTVYKSGFVI